MDRKEIRRKALRFLREQDLLRADYPGLRRAVARLGYTVIEFNHIFNDEAVQTLIDGLRLSDDILRSRGFTYADRNYRLVFVHEDLTQEEKQKVLAHEAGHICLGHLTSAAIIGRDVQEEYEANEFAHFLHCGSPLTSLQIQAARHKKLTAALAVMVALAILLSAVGVYFLREQRFYGDYYITATGNKYHEKECIFVKDKTTSRRLTVEEFESGKYERCHTCLP